MRSFSLATAAILIALAAYSAYFSFGISYTTTSIESYSIRLNDGLIEFWWNDKSFIDDLLVDDEKPQYSHGLELSNERSKWWPELCFSWRPYHAGATHFPGSSNYHGFYFPLWQPILLAMIAAVFSHVCSMIRGRRGKCNRCGYDRTGLAFDVRCPECGTRSRMKAAKPCTE